MSFNCTFCVTHRYFHELVSSLPASDPFASKNHPHLKIQNLLPKDSYQQYMTFFNSDSGRLIWYLVRAISSSSNAECCSILEQPILTLDKPKPETGNIEFVGALTTLQTEGILDPTLLERVAGVSSGFDKKEILTENLQFPTYTLLSWKETKNHVGAI